MSSPVTAGCALRRQADHPTAGVVGSGFVAAHREGRAGVFHDDDMARLFARFPQGVPAGVNVEALGALVANPSAGR